MSRIADKLIKAKTASEVGGFSVALVSAREGTGIADYKYHLIDISDVSNMTVLDTVEANDGTIRYRPARAAILNDGNNVGIAEQEYDAISYWDVSDATSMTLIDRERNTSFQYPGYNNFYGLVSDDTRKLFLGNGTTTTNWQAHFRENSTGIYRVYRSPNTSTFRHGFNQPGLDVENQVLFVTNTTLNSISAYNYNNTGSSFVLLSTLQDSTNLVNPRNFAFDETTGTLYVGLMNGDVTSVDASNVFSMSVIDRLANVSANQNYYDMKIDTTNQVLFASNVRNGNTTQIGGSVFTIDISDSANLAHLDVIDRNAAADLYFPVQMDVDVERQFLFAACTVTDKLVVLDYSDPSSLTVHSASSTSNFKQDEMLKIIR
jgi:hypothetical protein